MTAETIKRILDDYHKEYIEVEDCIVIPERWTGPNGHNGTDLIDVTRWDRNQLFDWLRRD